MKDDEILDRHIKDLEEDFGTVFGLRAFPGESFRINRGSSYVSEYGGERKVMIYVYRWDQQRDTWLAFSKGSPTECRSSFRSIPSSTEGLRVDA